MKRWLLVLCFLLLAVPAWATVNAVIARNDYLGNNSTQGFAYTFEIYDATAIEVQINGVDKSLNTDYTVSGVNSSGGGTVTFAVAPTTGAVITLLRKQPIQQQSIYTPNEAFPATRISGDLDKLTMTEQMLSEQIGRAPLLSKTSSYSNLTIPDPVPGDMLVWNNTLTGLQNVNPLSFPVPLPTSYSALLPSYTVAAGGSQLPTLCVDGSQANVTDNIRGVWKCKTNLWSSTTGTANPLDFGILPGAADSTVAMTAMIAAVPDGTLIQFPAGVFTFSAFTVPSTKTVHIRGVGGITYMKAAYANAAWLVNANFAGTVLRFTATSGYNVQLCPTNAGVYCASDMDDLMMIGPGSGTSTGLYMGNGSGLSVYNTQFRNLILANFAEGFHCAWCEGNSFYSLQLIGNGTAGGLSAYTNSNSFYGTQIQFNTLGMMLGGQANGNKFYGGSAQQNGDQAFNLGNGSVQVYGNLIDGFWFENPAATNAILMPASTGNNGNTISNNLFMGAGDNVSLQGNRNSFINNYWTPNFSLNLAITSATGTVVIGSVPDGTALAPGTFTNGDTTSTVLTPTTVIPQGAWTPVDASGASLTFTGVSAHYTRIGNLVTAYATWSYPVTVSVAAASFGGLPFAFPSANYGNAGCVLTYTTGATGTTVIGNNSTKTATFYTATVGAVTNANMSGVLVGVTCTYPVQ